MPRSSTAESRDDSSSSPRSRDVRSASPRSRSRCSPTPGENVGGGDCTKTVPGIRARVAIIGAGVSGLVTLKECLNEGLEVTCFEQANDLGGVWRYTDTVEENQGAAVYSNLVTNTSKEVMTFSDFPVADSCAPYLPHQKVEEYLQSYARSYDLLNNIVFGARIMQCEPCDNPVPGWSVKYSKSPVPRRGSCARSSAKISTRSTGSPTSVETETKKFDYLAVCSGYFRSPKNPCIEGLQDVFRNKKIHSHFFRTPDIFKGKTVLIVGNGVSAADIAVAASHVTSEVYLSIGKGFWLGRRLRSGGQPADVNSCRLFDYYAPRCLKNMVQRDRCEEFFDQRAFAGSDCSQPLDSQMVVNDDLGVRIATGQIRIKPQIANFTRYGVNFVDLSSVCTVDVVVLATGCEAKYEFLPKGYTTEERGVQGLYRNVWPVYPSPRIAFVGAFRSNGTPWPAIELQARWVASIISGQNSLPPSDVMRKEVHRREKMFPCHSLIKTKVDKVPYEHDLAKEVGCYPSFLTLLMKNPSVAIHVWLNPPFSVHYRLLGPHCWQPAWSRTANALKNSVECIYTSRCRRTNLKCVHIFAALLLVVMSTILFIRVLIIYEQRLHSRSTWFR